MFQGEPIDVEALMGQWGYVMESVEGFDPGHIIPGHFAYVAGEAHLDQYIPIDDPVITFVADRIRVADHAGEYTFPKFTTGIEAGASIRRIRKKRVTTHAFGWNRWREMPQCMHCRSFDSSGSCIEHDDDGPNSWEVVPDGDALTAGVFLHALSGWQPGVPASRCGDQRAL